jgi:putative NADH-flavin reductase
MSSYAILGATGQTGQALFTQLTSSKENSLHLFARSKTKLLEQNPSLSSPPPNIKLFIGGLSDTSLLTSCIRDVEVVFCVVATNNSTPGCHIAQDSAKAVLSAMSELRSTGSEVSLPRLVILSAAPVSFVLKKSIPSPVSWMLWRALGHLYRDLEAAEAQMKRERSWLRATFVYPGGLSNVGDDRVLGHKVTTEDAGSGFMSYGDLAAGMIEIADERTGKYDWVDVSVIPTTKGTKVAYGAVVRMLFGSILFKN